MKKCREIMKKIKYVMVFAVVFLLSFGANNMKTFASTVVDITLPCSLEFKIPKAFQDALEAENISVRLYRIADVTENGEYKDIAGYETLKLSELSPYVTAQQLEEKAKEVSEFIGANTWDETPVNTSYKQIEIINNQGKSTQLETGLYLVCVKETPVGEDTYRALPYLITLPGMLELKGSDGNVTPEWTYDLVVDLKLSCDTPDPEPDDVPEEIPDTPPEENPPEDEFKTGDDTNLSLLFGCVIFFGIAFVVVCFLEKRSRKAKQ